MHTLSALSPRIGTIAILLCGLFAETPACAVPFEVAIPIFSEAGLSVQHVTVLRNCGRAVASEGVVLTTAPIRLDGDQGGFENGNEANIRGLRLTVDQDVVAMKNEGDTLAMTLRIPSGPPSDLTHPRRHDLFDDVVIATVD